jgi:hypothetical protein
MRCPPALRRGRGGVQVRTIVTTHAETVHQLSAQPAGHQRQEDGHDLSTMSRVLG